MDSSSINLNDLASALLGPQNAASLGNYLTESGQSLYDGPRNMLHDLIGEAGPSTLQGMSGAASSALSAPIRAASGGNAGFGTAVDAVMNPLTLNQWGDRAERYYDPLEQRFSQENEALMKPVSAAGEAYLNHPLGMGFSAPKAAEGVSDAANVAKNFVEENAPGADQVNTFGGPRARNADLQKMATAQGMAAEGASPREIWDHTGWYQGPDNMWRFEIDDSKLALKRINSTPGQMITHYGRGSGGNPTREYIAPSGTFTSFSHPDLIGSNGAYRFNERVRGKYGYGEGGGQYFAPTEPEMIDWYKQAGLELPEDRRLGKIVATGFTQDRAKSTLAHELQHGIQFREGFAAGGNLDMWSPEEIKAMQKEAWDREANGAFTFHNPDGSINLEGKGEMRPWIPPEPPEHYLSADDAKLALYRRTAGEVESRNVEKRLGYTPEERADKPPFETQSVPNEKQILRNQWGAPYDPTKYDSRFRPIIPAVAGGALAAGALSPDDAHAEGAGHMDELPEGYTVRKSPSFDELPEGYKVRTPSFAQRAVNLLGTDDGVATPADPDAVKELAKGVPVAGAYVPTNERMADFEKRQPDAANTMQKIGRGAVEAPLMAVAPEVFGLEGSFGKRLVAGGLSGGGIDAADSLAHGGSANDAMMAGAKGAAFGTIPAVGGKIVSPNLSREVAEPLSRIMSRGAFAYPGYAAAHAMGLPGGEGALMGLLIGESGLKNPFKSYLQNNVMGDLAKALAPKVAPGATAAKYQGSPQMVEDLARILSKTTGPIIP